MIGIFQCRLDLTAKSNTPLNTIQSLSGPVTLLVNKQHQSWGTPPKVFNRTLNLILDLRQWIGATLEY